MKKEIERKFLISALAEPEILGECTRIIQGYLCFNPPIRVRIEDGKRSFLTIKLRGDEEGRLEFLYEIPLEDGEILLREHKYNLIEKTRYRIGQFEIDVFGGKLKGLVIAEIELDDLSQIIEIPSGISLREVTGNESFENQNLARFDSLPEAWRCKNVPEDL